MRSQSTRSSVGAEKTISFAAIWKQKIRVEEQKLRLNTDPHSPARYRVNGPLSNLAEFQKAFNLPDGSPMVRHF